MDDCCNYTDERRSGRIRPQNVQKIDPPHQRDIHVSYMWRVCGKVQKYFLMCLILKNRDEGYETAVPLHPVTFQFEYLSKNKWHAKVLLSNEYINLKHIS